MSPTTSARGLIIAAPASGSGKTTLTLALLRALRNAGVNVASAKAGPDYIDPAFHSAATGTDCVNLDTWAMSPRTINTVVASLSNQAELIIAEGVMGLFDGAPNGQGSAADLAKVTGWPVLLVVDAGGMARSAAAVVHGFATFDPELKVAAVIFNRTGSPAHAKLLSDSMCGQDITVLGSVQRSPTLALPDRHLGLVQAREHPDLEAFLESAAVAVQEGVDLTELQNIAQSARVQAPQVTPESFPPPGQHIAIARDDAFAFIYPHLLNAWRAAGASLTFFSPLNDEEPAPRVDAVFLPGGYPELHAGKIANNRRFIDGLRTTAAAGASVYGECGGYMVLGKTLTDARGQVHPMAGLLPIDTSFEHPKLKLGYREIEVLHDGPWGKSGTRLRGHEFHFASQTAAGDGEGLFAISNAAGEALGECGSRIGNVSGSFIHVVDRC